MMRVDCCLCKYLSLASIGSYANLLSFSLYYYQYGYSQAVH